MITAILIAMLITFVGFKMIGRVHSYENIWGAMFWLGAISVLLLSVLSIIRFILFVILL